MNAACRWPKARPPLTPEQTRVREDFMRYWHEILPSRYRAIENFNHRYPLRRWHPSTPCRVFEIGAGLGEHIAYENLHNVDYYALELRDHIAATIRHRFPIVTTIIGDIQNHLAFPSGYFDRIVAIHVLEHLPDLPRALEEINRLLAPTGRFDVVIPCEGGLSYAIARRISAQRIFEKRYAMSYDWFIRSEHVSRAHEILFELGRWFRITHSSYFPFLVPSINLNLCIGLSLTKPPACPS